MRIENLAKDVQKQNKYMTEINNKVLELEFELKNNEVVSFEEKSLEIKKTNEALEEEIELQGNLVRNMPVQPISNEVQRRESVFSNKSKGEEILFLQESFNKVDKKVAHFHTVLNGFKNDLNKINEGLLKQSSRIDYLTERDDTIEIKVKESKMAIEANEKNINLFVDSLKQINNSVRENAKDIMARVKINDFEIFKIRYGEYLQTIETKLENKKLDVPMTKKKSSKKLEAMDYDGVIEDLREEMKELIKTVDFTEIQNKFETKLKEVEQEQSKLYESVIDLRSIIVDNTKFTLSEETAELQARMNTQEMTIKILKNNVAEIYNNFAHEHKDEHGDDPTKSLKEFVNNMNSGFKDLTQKVKE